jgi:large subunit ribosomal protein L25
MDLTLTAETGRAIGSRSSTRLRTDGMVPAVVYGLGRDTVSVAVSWPELRRALSTEAGVNALINLDVDGQRDLAIVKDLQRHPVRRSVLHVDFLRVDADAPVAIDVPVVLTGEATKVEGRRGVVDQPLKSLTVLAKPADIPSSIEVAIDEIDIGDTVTVAELTLPAGVTTEVDPEAPVVSGIPTRFSVQLDHGVDPDALDDGLGGEGGGEEASAEGEDEGESAGEADEE